MVVVNETKRGQLLALLEQCAHLNADVRPRTDKGYFTVTVRDIWVWNLNLMTAVKMNFVQVNYLTLQMLKKSICTSNMTVHLMMVLSA